MTFTVKPFSHCRSLPNFELQHFKHITSTCLLPPPRRICNRRHLFVHLFVCLLATFRKNFRTELHKIGSRPSDHYFRSACLSVCLSGCLSVCLFVCLFVCAEFFSAVFDPIWIKLGHMLHVRV